VSGLESVIKNVRANGAQENAANGLTAAALERNLLIGSAVLNEQGVEVLNARFTRNIIAGCDARLSLFVK
jgi:hypothetical protein